jgi:GT2 family glycosyltransferase
MSKVSPIQPKVSIVILNWNTRDLLKKYLPEVVLYCQNPVVEVIVADNGSTDDSVELVTSLFPKIKIIKLSKNYGFAGGYNLALRKIKSKYTVLLNSDVTPGKNWLSPMIELMDTHPDAGACMPKIKDINHPCNFEYAGAAGGFMDKWGYTFCRGRIFDQIEEDRHQYDATDEIFWGSGAALMVRTELFNETGGLDEDFFAHMEEIDWCWRIKNQGYTIWHVAQSEVYHLGGGTLNAMSPQKTYLNFRNNLFMLYRNLPALHFKRTLTIRLLLDGLAAFKFIFSGEWSNFRAILRAHRDYFSSRPHLHQERVLLRKNIKTENHSEIYHRSIVYDFFIKGKRKFSEIRF